MTLRSDAGVLVARRFAQYKDQPGKLYHFPKESLLTVIESLVERPVVIYEPKRGGLSARSVSGGRSAYVGCAILGRVFDDVADPTHAYVETLDYVEFGRPVPLKSASIPGKSLQTPVRALPLSVIEPIIRAGLGAEETVWPAVVREGLVDPQLPPNVELRDLIQVIQNRVVRDRSFRLRVVEQAYAGQCAISRLRLTNGYGRAEVDAAHILPVAEGGPDSTKNGLALTKTLHWAFDRGLISIANNGRILTVERGLEGPIHALLPPDRMMLRPKSEADWPHEAFLAWHRANKFKGNVESAPPK